MSDLAISIEAMSPALLDLYRGSGMERGKAGTAALSWTFGDTALPFAVARQAEEIVGLSAYIRTRARFGQEAGDAYQAVDSFVAPAARGRGVFTRLARAYDDHIAATGGDLIWGFPNDNASKAWFQNLNWHAHGQVPFLVKPLRAGFFLRKLGLGLDMRLSFARDRGNPSLDAFGDWADALWEEFAAGIGCATIRDRAYLTHRLLQGPNADQYRTVAASDPGTGALVAFREAAKHGGRIAYLMEAMGGARMRDLLASELGRLCDRGVELALAWAYPWSPNYSVLRRLGFRPLPERLRPIHIWFGSRPLSTRAAVADRTGQWYLSYLDSDTV